MQEGSGCCLSGSCTTPSCVGPYPGHIQHQERLLRGGYQGPRPGYSTLQSHPKASLGHSSHRDICGFSPRFSLTENYATLRRGLYPANTAVHSSAGASFSKTEFGHTKVPQILPAAPGISTSSSVVSSDLNHSVTTSDTSDVSSERDRESEVWIKIFETISVQC